MSAVRSSTVMLSASIMLATIMQVLDTTIANVALPHMRGSLSAGTDQITWVLTSYIVASAIMTLPVGYLAQRYGRRKVFLVSVIGFTVASMLCGQASTLTEMIVWRIVQGVFGASLVPLSQSTLLDTFPPEKHASAMSIWGVGVMLGPVMGPTLGGWLTEYYSWRWVFYVNLPLGILSVIGILLYMPETERRIKRFDGLGFAFLALSVATAQLLLDRGEHADWFNSLEIQTYAIAAVLGLYLFIVHTRTSDHQFLSPALFRDRNFVSSTAFIFLVGIILLSTMTLLPIFLQQWKGYPVATTGLILMPRGIGTMFAMLLVGKLMRFIDDRVLIVAGMGFIALSLHQMAGFTLQVSQQDLVTSGLVQGVGLGLVFIPTSTLAYATLSSELRNEAAALFSLSRNLGSSIGVSMVMAFLSRNMWINQQELSSRIQPTTELLQGLGSPQDMSMVPHLLTQEVARQAAEIAYISDFQLLMWITLAAMPLALLLKTPKPGAVKA